MVRVRTQSDLEIFSYPVTGYCLGMGTQDIGARGPVCGRCVGASGVWVRVFALQRPGDTSTWFRTQSDPGIFSFLVSKMVLHWYPSTIGACCVIDGVTGVRAHVLSLHRLGGTAQDVGRSWCQYLLSYSVECERQTERETFIESGLLKMIGIERSGTTSRPLIHLQYITANRR